MSSLISSNYFFKNQKNFYRGKVRDVYSIGSELLVMVASDRISAFDVVMPKAIPYKGQVLNQTALFFLDKTAEIVPNWKISSPHPNVTIGKACEPIPVEMVIRGYLSGHAWREYKSGKRVICGVEMPDGMRENDRFPEPIITPTIKAKSGHDMDTTRDEILMSGVISESNYVLIENYTRQLFHSGSQFANSRGLILVDTKYEFGLYAGEVTLMDEIHTPDSSRYFYADTYAEIQAKDQQQRQLSKEFVRQWLIQHDFQGLEGQSIPVFPETFIDEITSRYIELYEKVTGLEFQKTDYSNIQKDIEFCIQNELARLGN